MNATTISDLTRENGWAPLRAHLGARAFGINAYTKNADEQHRRRAQGGGVGTRGAVPRRRRPREVHGGRGGARRAGGHRGARPVRDDALGGRARGRDDDRRRRRPPRRGVPAARVGDERGHLPDVRRREDRGGARDPARRGRRSTRTASRSSTTSRAARRGSATSTWRSSTSSARSPAARISSSSPVATTTWLRCGTMPATTSWSVRLRRRPAEPDARRLTRPGPGRVVASSACSMRATWRSFFVSLRRLSMGFEGSPVER